MWQHFYPVTGTTATQTFQVQLRDNVGTGTVESLQVIAFRLPANADFQFVETEAPRTVTTNVWADYETLNFTPSSPGDYLIFGLATVSEDPGNESIGVRLTDPSGGFWPVNDSGTRVGHFTNTRLHERPFFVARVQNLPATPQTFRIQANGSTLVPPDSTIRYTRLMAFRTDAFASAESVLDAPRTSTNSATPVVKSTLTTVAPPAARDYIVIQSMIVHNENSSETREVGFRAR